MSPGGPPADRDGVPSASLYKVGDDEFTAIDRKEGHGWAYTRVVLPVRLEAGGPERMAVTYTVLSKEPTEIPPSRKYLGRVITAARERGLPEPYLERLEGQCCVGRPARMTGRDEVMARPFR